MKRSFAVVALLSGALILTRAWAGPVLDVKPATYQWGRQAENKGEYPFTFTVKNVGDEELRIERVRAGCSCTKVELKKQTLAPGESTEMSGVLSTKGMEGAMHKGIILTSNDLTHQTLVANLEIRFPISGQGLRIRSTPTVARLREGALWAYVTIENCEADKDIQVQAMELPSGWQSPQALPLLVKAEDRATVALTLPLGADSEPAQFDQQPFTLVTDCAKTARVQGSLTYRPEGRATVLSVPAGAAPALDGAPKVRWPMTKPLQSVVAPSTTPVASPSETPPAVAPGRDAVQPAAPAPQGVPPTR